MLLMAALGITLGDDSCPGGLRAISRDASSVLFDVVLVGGPFTLPHNA